MGKDDINKIGKEIVSPEEEGTPGGTLRRSKTWPSSAKSLMFQGTTQQEEVRISVGAEPYGRDREVRERKHLALCAPLLQAALKGDWKAGEAFLKEHPHCIALPITKAGGTALHNAAAAKRTTFVKELVKLMSPFDLELKVSAHGTTALFNAAQSGSVTIARELVEKNDYLPCIRMNHGKTPLGFIAWCGPGYKKMTSYLFSVAPYQQLTTGERTDHFFATISSDMFDIALKILKIDPKLPLADKTPIPRKASKILEINPEQLADRTPIVWDALKMLASKPLAIGSKSRLSMWERCLNACFDRCFNKCFNGFCNKALMRTLAHQLVENLWKESARLSDGQFLSNKAMAENHMALLAEAAKVGNVEFLIILIRSHPYLLWEPNEKYGSLFHIAITYRRENVFALIYEIGSVKDFVPSLRDKNQNNMLHLAGHLAPSERLDIVPGAALQMQRELLWFKEIEKIVPPSFANMKNKEDQLTPKDLFRQKHRALLKAGEKWIKDTANSCMLVATLIATVVFAATFTVPGGSNQDTGIPIFLENNWFTVFFVSIAIALLSSSTSILIFLSVLTSRYTEDDFLKRLPRRLVFGLSTLFLSIVSMVIAFSATCFLVYNSKSASVPTIIFAAAGIPISLFIVLQYDLWVDIIRSTYMSKFLFRNKHRLF